MLLISTSYDLVFRFELTYILRLELTTMELILDSMTLTVLYPTVCELLYEHLICVCLCNKNYVSQKKIVVHSVDR